MNMIDLFSGIGGFSLAAQWVWGNSLKIKSFVERDQYCQKVLNKNFPGVPIHDDIKTFKGSGWGAIDIITGGFPCQPFSVAGKQGGTEDDRFLWPEMLRVIKEARPRWVVGENVPGIINLALDDVLSSLENEGYTTQAFIIPACGTDAKHWRDRVWIVANAFGLGRGGRNNGDARGLHGTLQTERPCSSNECGVLADTECKRTGVEESYTRRQEWEFACLPQPKMVRQRYGAVNAKRAFSSCKNVADTNSNRTQRNKSKYRQGCGVEQGSKVLADTEEPRLEGANTAGGIRTDGRDLQRNWMYGWLPEPAMGELVNGVSDRLVRFAGRTATRIPNRPKKLKALGNAIVPQVAERIFWAIKQVDGKSPAEAGP